MYLLEKMDAVHVADGSSLLLLDHTLFTYGSGLGDGSTHLWLTQARAMGMEIDRFTDSTGEIGAVLA